VKNGSVSPLLSGVFFDDEGLCPIVIIAFALKRFNELQKSILKSENQSIKLLKGRELDLAVPRIDDESGESLTERA